MGRGRKIKHKRRSTSRISRKSKRPKRSVSRLRKGKVAKTHHVILKAKRRNTSAIKRDIFS